MTAELPTPEEVAAAKETLRRDAEARALEERAKVQPIIDLAASPEFAAVLQAMAAIDPALAADRRIRPFLHAMETGMEGVANFASQFAAPLTPPSE
jgi:hypothetical protein